MSATLDLQEPASMEMSSDRPAPGAILSVEDLTVSFDGFRAVDGLSLRVAQDELRVIIGPNGAGKTTLLDIICGKTRPSAGRVMFQGRDLVRMAEFDIVRAGVGRKFQTPSVYEDLTVLENFEISLPNAHGWCARCDSGARPKSANASRTWRGRCSCRTAWRRRRAA